MSDPHTTRMDPNPVEMNLLACLGQELLSMAVQISYFLSNSLERKSRAVWRHHQEGKRIRDGESYGNLTPTEEVDTHLRLIVLLSNE